VPAATVQFAGLVVPGEFQFNFVVPGSLADGDQPITASHSGSVTQPGTLITIQHWAFCNRSSESAAGFRRRPSFGPVERALKCSD